MFLIHTTLILFFTLTIEAKSTCGFTADTNSSCKLEFQYFFGNVILKTKKSFFSIILGLLTSGKISACKT